MEVFPADSTLRGRRYPSRFMPNPSKSLALISLAQPESLPYIGKSSLLKDIWCASFWPSDHNNHPGIHHISVLESSSIQSYSINSSRISCQGKGSGAPSSQSIAASPHPQMSECSDWANLILERRPIDCFELWTFLNLQSCNMSKNIAILLDVYKMSVGFWFRTSQMSVWGDQSQVSLKPSLRSRRLMSMQHLTGEVQVWSIDIPEHDSWHELTKNCLPFFTNVWSTLGHVWRTYSIVAVEWVPAWSCVMA